MFMRRVCIVFVFLAGLGARAQTANPAVPPAANVRFSTPAIDAGDYVYVSGQGPRRTDGSLPSTFSDQVQQALDNINSALRTVGDLAGADAIPCVAKLTAHREFLSRRFCICLHSSSGG